MQEIIPTIELHGFDPQTAENTKMNLRKVLEEIMRSKPHLLKEMTVSIFPSTVTNAEGAISLIRFFGTKYSQCFIVEALRKIGWKGKIEVIKLKRSLVI